MNIDIKNYQAYILDYYEGNLSEKQAAKLMSFLEKHPDLKKEFEEFEVIELRDDCDTDVTYQHKGLLKKPEPEYNLPVTDENFELFCIAEAEGLLNEKETEELNRFVAQDPSFRNTREKYALAFAKPDEKIVFQSKEDLKKQPSMKVVNPEITDNNYEEFFSAFIDGSLTASQERGLEAYLKENPGRAKELSLWEKTKLEPDYNIVFPNKSSLKRHQIGAVRKIWYSMSAAAAVLIIAGLFFMNGFLLKDQIQYADIVIKHPESITGPIEESIKPAETTQGAVETPVMLTTDEPEAKKHDMEQAIQDKEVPEKVEAKPLKASLLASVPPQKIASGSKSYELITQDPPQFYDADSKPIQVERRDDDYITIPQLALAELQKRSGVDVGAVAPERLSFWDLAGQGLAAISQVTGNSLTVKKERNKKGNVTFLAIGNNFEISRRQHSAEE